MKKLFILYFIGLTSCAVIEEYEEIPTYEEVSRVVTPKGKTINFGLYYLSFPEGAVSQDFIVPDPFSSRPLYDSENPAKNNVPPFIWAPNDKFYRYDKLETFIPMDIKFNRDVTVSFTKPYYGDYKDIFELKENADSTLVSSWVNRTEDFRLIEIFDEDMFSSTFIGTEANKLSKYLICTGYRDDKFYVDDKEYYSYAVSWKPKLKADNRYHASISNDENEYRLTFVALPSNGDTYQVYDSFSKGLGSNSLDTHMEIQVGINCGENIDGYIYCDEIFLSKSGTLKYIVDENGSHFVMFKNVIIKGTDTGTEKALNGFQTLLLD